MIAEVLLACMAYIPPAFKAPDGSGLKTLTDIIRVESGGNSLALHVNGISNQPHPSTMKEAADTARHWIAKGYSVDLGLMQWNSRNIGRLSIEQALDPCINIQGGSTIFANDYAAAAQRVGPGQEALKIALSKYNTGSPTGGFANGYVARYYKHAVPEITIAASDKSKVREAALSRYAYDTEVW